MVTAYLPSPTSGGSTASWLVKSMLPQQAQPIDMRRQFEYLANEWHKDTDHLSSPRQIAAHPAYLQITAMGKDAIQYILRDLQRRGGDWYLALRAINGGMSPVTNEMSQSSAAVRDAWLQWGRNHGYLA